MKVRTDFVTNSSSSSFIIGYNDDKDLKHALVDEIPPEFFSQVYRDIKMHDFTQDDCESRIYDFEWEARAEFMDELERKFNSYKAAREWGESHKEEMNDYISKRSKEMMEEFREKLGKYKKHAIVEYSDHTDPELEVSVLPSFSRTIERISHH